ncbi:antitoxin Xre-like helix-turn-helix domain-containing protein [Gemmatimonas sp.]|jgi:transposase|uniref:antitoxin Xre-like helix-turn-helix domain-containing protein n=1 Tax=Gemmatimonas sp. TaxID=1962908 RepID=UPI0037C19FA3
MQIAPGPAAAPDAGLVVAKALMSAAARLGLSNRQVAVIIGTSEASVSRLQRGRGCTP